MTGSEELELKQYQEIGTVEECKNAMKKQISQKLIRQMKRFDDKYSFLVDCFCPNCNKFFTFESEKGLLDYSSINSIYCSSCGQNIDLTLDYYCLENIKRNYEYYIIIRENPHLQKELDLVMNILVDAWKTNQPDNSEIKNRIVKINNENKYFFDVADKLIKLKKESIAYAIKEFSQQTGQIENSTDFMIEVLYNTVEQWVSGK